jgi:UDPglucose 6-dehydrogenase
MTQEGARVPAHDAGLSVVGLGKLGAVVAACLASRGFRVVGLDSDPRVVERVRSGVPPVQEPGLEAVMRSCGGRLTATQDYDELVSRSDVTLILVPTPSDPEGAYVVDSVLAVCREIGARLRRKEGYHLVAVNSTVLPGDMDRRIRPALEEASGRRAGRDFGLCYNPEFVAIGSVVRDFLNPDLVLIGESDARAGDLLAGVMARACENRPVVARMNFVNAELTKLALNSYVTMKITFANLLGRLCERLPDADADVVTAALGRDSRIGPKYLKPGLGYGGPCFPRDNAALSVLARRVGLDFPLADATDAANRRQVARLVQMVKEVRGADGRVGVLGLSYKPNTDVTDESQGLQIAESLSRDGIPVIVYDPLAMQAAKNVLGERVRYAASAEDCASGADVLVLATAWPEFRQIDTARLNGTAVIDCWGLLERPADGSAPGIRVLGKGPVEARGDGQARRRA